MKCKSLFEDKLDKRRAACSVSRLMCQNDKTTTRYLLQIPTRRSDNPTMCANCIHGDQWPSSSLTLWRENRRKDRSLPKKHQHSGILKGPTTALSHINLPNSLKLCHLTFLEPCPWIWGDLSPEFSKRETVHSVVEQRVVAVVVLQIVNKVLQCCKCFQANDKIQHGILNEGYEKTGPKTKYQSALVYLSLFASTQANQT